MSTLNTSDTTRTPLAAIARQTVFAVAAFLSASMVFSASTAMAQESGSSVYERSWLLQPDADTRRSNDSLWQQSDDARPVTDTSDVQITEDAQPALSRI